MVLYGAIVVIVGYFLGNINGAILISNYVIKDDIRSRGSGNAGLTNYFRTYGGLKTLAVLAIDMVKTVVGCLVGYWLLGQYATAQVGMMIGGFAVCVGHDFPVLLKMKGGKGIVCSATVALMLDWYVFAILIALFIVIFASTHFVSLGSVLCAALFPFLFWWRFAGQWIIVTLAFAIGLLAIVMHRSNIGRLLKGTESKVYLNKNRKRE